MNGSNWAANGYTTQTPLHFPPNYSAQQSYPAQNQQQQQLQMQQTQLQASRPNLPAISRRHKPYSVMTSLTPEVEGRIRSIAEEATVTAVTRLLSDRTFLSSFTPIRLTKTEQETQQDQLKTELAILQAALKETTARKDELELEKEEKRREKEQKRKARDAN